MVRWNGKKVMTGDTVPVRLEGLMLSTLGHQRPVPDKNTSLTVKAISIIHHVFQYLRFLEDGISVALL